MVLAAGLAVALTVLPHAVESTGVRIWLGVGLFALTLSGAAGIAIYALRHVSYRPDSELIEKAESTAPSDSSSADSGASTAPPIVRRK